MGCRNVAPKLPKPPFEDPLRRAPWGAGRSRALVPL